MPSVPVSMMPMLVDAMVCRIAFLSMRRNVSRRVYIDGTLLVLLIYINLIDLAVEEICIFSALLMYQWIDCLTAYML